MSQKKFGFENRKTFGRKIIFCHEIFFTKMSFFSSFTTAFWNSLTKPKKMSRVKKKRPFFFDFRNQFFLGTYILGDVARVKFSAPTDE